MSLKTSLEIYDVTIDGFPTKKQNAVAFIWGGDVYTGWPLIDFDNSYPENRNSFSTPEQAKAEPLNVRWEASEDRGNGEFSGVRFWFLIPELPAN